MRKNYRTMKVNDEVYDFITNIISNRIKVGSDSVPLHREDIPLLIVKYFKLNNDRYLELVKLGENNGIK
jgi:hypothetical protein